MCTHTYTPAQCCDLDSFWFLSADDWQVLNESSLERLPSRPVHQLSTYNTRTHARSLPYLYSHTHPQTHLLSLSARILHPISEPQSVRPLLKERLTVSGRHGRFSSIILSLWSGLIQHRRNVSCTVVRYGSIQTRYSSKQYGLVEVQVHERVCRCAVRASVMRWHSWRGEDGNPEKHIFSPLHAFMIHPSSHLCYLLSFCEGAKTQLKYYVDGYAEERHTSSMTLSLPPVQWQIWCIEKEVEKCAGSHPSAAIKCWCIVSKIYVQYMYKSKSAADSPHTHA